MPRLSYVNGRYVPHEEAAVHIEDRGFQFADGVYEVVTVVNGRLVDEKGHIDRLERSLGELRIPAPVQRRVLGSIMRQLIRRNGVRNGLVYLQITRGSAPRDFKFPSDTEPTLVMTTKRIASFASEDQVRKGWRIITIPEIRWLRRDIKSVALLAQVLGKQRAAEAGAGEAWQVAEDGTVTEGTSSNAWIVTKEGRIVTRPANHLILNGVTRLTILRLATEAGFDVEERPFTVEEAKNAAEAFVSSASTFVMPVTRIDDAVIGSGEAGPISLRLRQAYIDYANGAGAS